MGNYVKSIVVFLGLVADVFITYLDDGKITSGEIPLIVAGIAVLVGTYFLPNTKNGENVNVLADRELARKNY